MHTAVTLFIGMTMSNICFSVYINFYFVEKNVFVYLHVHVYDIIAVILFVQDYDRINNTSLDKAKIVTHISDLVLSCTCIYLCN